MAYGAEVLDHYVESSPEPIGPVTSTINVVDKR